MYPFKESQIYTSFQYLRTMLFGVPRTKKAAAVIWCRTIRAVLRKTAACGRFMLACGLTYVYFNVFTNIVNKKTNKKALFLPPFTK
jgi:hypothetical protein